MPDVITFGEAMIRLSPPHFQRLEQTATLDVQVGGGELNVAVGVARLGLTSAWVSALPENCLGRLVENRARQAGVDTSNVFWSSDADARTGLYVVQFGAAPRASTVPYDRRNSAICAIQPGQVNWQKVMVGARWFHASGVGAGAACLDRKRRPLWALCGAAN
jgi:2-dehydro-3-deoxygluconokinase